MASVSEERERSVVVLGAGLCCKPLVVYLSQHGYKVRVCSRTLGKAQELCEGLSNTEPQQIDISQEGDAAKLAAILPQHCMVISMLPWTLHGLAAQLAVEHDCHFLTTSYVQPGVRQWDAEAQRKGLVIINECGVDPGTDHMSAKKVIDHVHQQGGRVVSFSSFCGGLPAPECNNNPFGYKFSWAPKGVLLASMAPAKYYRNNEEVSIAAGTLFVRPHFLQDVQVQAADFLAEQRFEAYPNRDSTPYRDIYQIPEAHSLIRGTYRYHHWCDLIQRFGDLGLLNTELRSFDADLTFAQLLRQLIGAPAGTALDEASLAQAVAQFLHLSSPADDFIVEAYQWLGLLSETPVSSVSTQLSSTSTLDLLCQLMQSKMPFLPGEKDLLLLQHQFIIEYADRRETLTSTLVELGNEEGTAMARTVAIPVAIAARLVLEKKFTVPGLSIPTIPELYLPILQELDEKFNIRYIEKVVSSEPLSSSSSS